MELATFKLAISTLSPVISKLSSYVYDSYFGGDVTAEEMKKLTNVFLPKIKTVIQEAESVPSDFLRPWLEDLQEAAFEAEDVIDLYEYNKIKYQVSSLPHFIKKSILKTKESLGSMRPKSSFKVSFEKLQNSAKEAESLLPFIKSARRQLKDKNAQASTRTSTSTGSTLASPIFGREKECDIIIKFLLQESLADSNRPIEKTPIIAIKGLGGSGKTTLAQSVYNHEKVKEFDLRMWVHVTRSFDVHGLTKKIIESANGDECPHIDNFDVLQTELKKSISKAKKFLLVLDDIWCEDKMQWDQLLSPLNEVKGKGSKIIITTRTEKVASVLHVDPVVTLEELKMNDCWSILKHYAFDNSEATIEDRELENIGNQIIRKVKYSPLALRVVGSLLYKQVSVDKWANIFKQDILKDTMSVLLLSFQHLPSHLQRCFGYCSLFPKNYIFYSNELVPLWIAQGFVENINESELTLEEQGIIYFKELISYSFLETWYGSCYKMHDLVHDLAENVSRKYYHRIEEDSLHIPATCIHLSVYWMDFFKRVDKPDMSKLKNLRSFIILNHHVDSTAFENNDDIFPNLAKLRALHVKSNLEVEALSYRRICELKHLRYLNLDVSELQLDKLYHLQFLYLNKGYYKRKLNGNLNIGKLPSLRSLDIFHPKKNDVSGMMPLKNLNLYGSLSVYRLENVKNEAEAAEAVLNKKKNLNDLKLEWSKIDRLNSCEDVLEGLEPHPNLERLFITGYEGVKVSNWMKIENWLPCLRYLELKNCRSLKEVPYLPPRLEHLCVEECNELMQLPPIGDTLHTLNLRNCSKLMPPSMSNKSLRLSSIQIYGCSGNENQLFNDLPFLSSLQNLELGGFSNLETFPSLSPTVTKLWISDFPKLTSMGSLQHCTSLSFLRTERCPMLTCLEGLQYCTSLSYFEIRDCPLLTCLEGLQYCTSLSRLIIYDCPMLTCLEGLQYYTSLSDLFITVCPMLTCLEGLQYCTSLSFLSIKCCPMLTCLEGLQYCTSLSRLIIYDCPMLTCLEGLQYCTSLSHLFITLCPILTCLDGLQYCTSLRVLYIMKCPVLMRDESILVDGDITLRLPCSIIDLKLDGSGRPFPPLLEENLHRLSSLNRLKLEGFTTLPSLEKLSSLRCFVIKDCLDVELLSNLPISLVRLEVHQCPKVKVKYEEGGPLHNTISHIPNLDFD